MDGIEIASKMVFYLPNNIGSLIMYGMIKYGMIEGQAFNENMTNNMFDKQVLKQYPEIGIKLPINMKQAYYLNRIIGVKDDLRMMLSSKDWGDFQLKQVCNEFTNFQQIMVYSVYGLNDTNVPPTHGHYIDSYFKKLNFST